MHFNITVRQMCASSFRSTEREKVQLKCKKLKLLISHAFYNRI